MDYIAPILSSILTSAFVVWIARTWIAERLKGAIKSEYDEKLESFRSRLKSESDVSLARVSAELQIAAARQNVEHSRLHETRATKIAELYSEILELYWIGTAYLTGNHPKLEKEKRFNDQLQETWVLVHKSKIYFTKEQAAILEGFISEMDVMGIDRMFAAEDYRSTDDLARAKAARDNQTRWNKIRNVLPKMLEAVEDNFRLLVGVK